MSRLLRIGTRGSPLALAQARLVAEAIRERNGWDARQIEIVPITTTGDIVRDRPLAEIGGKALWTKELDRALVEGTTDISVHSMKDVESIRPETMRIAAILPRGDVRDRLIGAESLAALTPGARVGTSSPRRKAQVLRVRPDVEVVPYRGNVGSRLAKLGGSEADATILAAAGLERLGMANTGTAIEDMLPAPAQGAVGIEARADDRRTIAMIQEIGDAATEACVGAERRMLAALGGTCRSPVAALAVLEGNQLWLRAQILTEEGDEAVEAQARFAPDDGEAPVRLAIDLIEQASPRLRALFGQ